MDQPVDYGKGSVIAPNGHFKRRPRDSDEAGEGIQKDSKHHTEVNGANTGPAVDSSGMTDIRDEDEKRQDDVKAAEDGEDASDTAVESLDEERTQPTSHTKSGEAGHDKDYRNTPAGHLNDVEIGKHDADNYAGRTAVAA
ncbi:hypothetical protein AAFC00_000777 [Neodothiora populina]|uniref:Uncharacterized protein n=1 Tax=Neodothiora populina TaxID=2781224 RepID=A0ABR3PLP1_9PEZI